MKIDARFYVAQVTQYASGTTRPGFADPAPVGEIVLRPANSDETNKVWASATPSGEIKMTVRGTAFPWFQEHLGKTLHITFGDVPDKAPESA